MKISNVLTTAGEWLRGEGPHHQIVISSRVRLARNLRNRPFPGWAKKAERSSILELIRSRVETLPEMQQAFKLVDKIDSALESKLDFAFDPHLGYLTACPTNVGTGMRASAMLHLPGLVLSELINQVIQAVSKIGLAVRGLYGEGTEAMGNLFQISNQTTLGEKEEEIINRLTKVIETIIEKEHDARQVLLQKKPNTLSDQIGRAYGVLTFAHAMASKEALNLLSIIKLGVDLGAFPEERRLPIDELFIDTQPAHLQKSSQQKLNAEERDHLRAQIIRERLKVLPKPDISKLATDSGNGSSQASSEQ